MLPLHAQIESILFYSSEALSTETLMVLCEASQEEIERALLILKENLIGHGLVLMQEGNLVALGTHPDASTLIERLHKKELSEHLGKAALETLAIIVYEGPVAKADIDYVRGVNSNTILRNLRIRGLIDKIEKEGSTFYTPTIDTLQYLGVSSVQELPDYETIREKLQESNTLTQRD